mmetsp:Transcript_115813/g.334459  ORF Transcript_115813/g.334459 Transcript_115813/m.334459 type:complete len:298 (+) Transcript_115813:251-1144(+)
MGQAVDGARRYARRLLGRWGRPRSPPCRRLAGVLVLDEGVPHDDLGLRDGLARRLLDVGVGARLSGQIASATVAAWARRLLALGVGLPRHRWQKHRHFRLNVELPIVRRPAIPGAGVHGLKAALPHPACLRRPVSIALPDVRVLLRGAFQGLQLRFQGLRPLPHGYQLGLELVALAASVDGLPCSGSRRPQLIDSVSEAAGRAIAASIGLHELRAQLRTEEVGLGMQLAGAMREGARLASLALSLGEELAHARLGEELSIDGGGTRLGRAAPGHRAQVKQKQCDRSHNVEGKLATAD